MNNHPTSKHHQNVSIHGHTHLEELQEEQDVDPDDMDETHDHDESHPGLTGDVMVDFCHDVAGLGRMQDKQVWPEKVRVFFNTLH